MTLAFGLACEAERRSLMRLAAYLCRNSEAAKDLVQDTMLRAMEKEHLFQPGTNLGGWLCSMMRHMFLDEKRRLKTRMTVADPDGKFALKVEATDNQLAALIAKQDIALLNKVTPSLVRAVMLAADGEELAVIAEREGVPIGTVKSRVSRGRARLAELVGA